MTGSLTLAIGILSSASLAYQILLVRLFAIEQFHHFAAMAISIAMLGFGISGSALAFTRLTPVRADVWLLRSVAASAPLFAVSPLLARAIPLDAARLPWDPTQWVLVAGLYATLAAPFAAGSLATLLAIQRMLPRPGTLYGTTFLGAAGGAVLAVLVLWVLPADHAVFFPGAGAAVALPLVTRRAGPLVAAGAGATVAATGLLGAGPEARVNPYKGLPQVAAYPNARRVAQAHSPLGWVVGVAAPAFRYAPGLSLSYAGEFPDQIALFVDGETAGAVMDAHGEASELFRWLPVALPYALQPRRVAVLGSEGGVGVQVALAHGAESVLAVEPHPGVVRLARRALPTDGPSPFADPRVRVVIADTRSVLAGERGSFDLITVGPSGRFGASSGGLHALSEDFGHTVEAYALYLRRLAPGGTMSVTQWVTVPPRAAVRSILTVAAALREAAAHALERGLVVTHGWSTVTILARPDGFDDAAVRALEGWAEARGLDLDWYPAVDAAALRPVNVLGSSDLTAAAAAATASAEAAAQFADPYPFAVAPATDARPYPHHYLSARAALAMLGEQRGSWLPFAEWGPIAAVAAAVQAAALAVLCILLPAFARGGRALPVTRWARVVSYFGLVGFAYMAAEIAAIQQLQLLLGHPVYATAALLALVLCASGLGAIWSDRIPDQRGPVLVAVLALILMGCASGLLPLAKALLPAPITWRSLAGLLCLAPLGVLMGTPFSLGLRRLTRQGDGSVGWAWASNAFASVVAAPLAVLVAMELGSPIVFALAAGAYLTAAVLYGWYRR